MAAMVGPGSQPHLASPSYARSLAPERRVQRPLPCPRVAKSRAKPRTSEDLLYSYRPAGPTFAPPRAARPPGKCSPGLGAFSAKLHCALYLTVAPAHCKLFREICSYSPKKGWAARSHVGNVVLGLGGRAAAGKARRQARGGQAWRGRNRAGLGATRPA